eukprot:CAMPEP_0113949040 /NCGR_PEP_ID=MMETSP1339-20121228/73524_1 /TAXON_ID=94617 /ORGANISM="Fibrocapsa japonica" /LENGTH=133 /DNA_ID=CAMNT_0000956341 /DNA_START=471 /DNA_END=869 /DNA_ORIENTATION=+ /assembly_acc=CAM_ASM_000762
MALVRKGAASRFFCSSIFLCMLRAIRVESEAPADLASPRTGPGVAAGGGLAELKIWTCLSGMPPSKSPWRSFNCFSFFSVMDGSLYSEVMVGAMEVTFDLYGSKATGGGAGAAAFFCLGRWSCPMPRISASMW